jgi:carboxylesterase type B
MLQCQHAYTLAQDSLPYYLFSNIPYSEQPVGSLRFSAPGLPTGSSSSINNGSVDVQCMQSTASWLLAQEATANGISLAQITQIFYTQAGQTEACLVLDVHVPKGIFDNSTASKGKNILSLYFAILKPAHH